jgi:hypothetical protein
MMEWTKKPSHATVPLKGSDPQFFAGSGIGKKSDADPDTRFDVKKEMKNWPKVKLSG